MKNDIYSWAEFILGLFVFPVYLACRYIHYCMEKCHCSLKRKNKLKWFILILACVICGVIYAKLASDDINEIEAIREKLDYQRKNEPIN